MPSIIFLGTSSAKPSKQRNVSCFAVRLEDARTFLIDCGEATQHQIIRTSDVKESKIEAIFITHMHGDHVFGLPGLLATFSLNGRQTPLKVVGPFGIKEYVESNMRLSSTYITYPIEFVELKEGAVTDLGLISDHYVSAYPIVHKVSCFGFVVREQDKKGRFDSERAKAMGVQPGKDMGILASGKELKRPDGTILRGTDFIGETRVGKKMILLGDTSDASSMLEVAQNCDVIVHETTLDASMETTAIERGHSTSVMAARFATAIKAKKLIITHFSPRYHLDPSEATETNQQQQANSLTVADLLNEAQGYCKEQNSDTIVVAAEDLQKYDV